MNVERTEQPQQPEQKETPRGNGGSKPPPMALLPELPPGRVDVTGIMPEGIRIDPDITEGHPGYEESGDSGIIPPERLARGGTPAEEGKAE
jgi:hypothetical protein